MEERISLKEAAALLGLTGPQVYRLAQRGEFGNLHKKNPLAARGSPILVSKARVLEVLEQMREPVKVFE